MTIDESGGSHWLQSSFVSFVIRQSSVLWHARVYLVSPTKNSAFEILYLPEPRRSQKVHSFSASDTGPAVGYDIVCAVELVHSGRQLAQRNQVRAGDPADLPFVRLAHVEQEDGLLLVE